MIKKLLAMILVLCLAAVVYVVGCGMINEATALQPDIVVRMVEQPSFENTARPW